MNPQTLKQLEKFKDDLERRIYEMRSLIQYCNDPLVQRYILMAADHLRQAWWELCRYLRTKIES
jgi:hypothetical protein